jgi:Tol biopolymer transport system component
MITRRVVAISRVAACSAVALAVSLNAGPLAHAAVDNHLTHVTVGIDGVQPDGDNVGLSAVSADGRYVAFSSSASNLTPGVAATGGLLNVYLRDTVAGTTTLISHKSDGTANNLGTALASISADGRYVVYSSRVGMTSAGIRLKLWDRDTDTTTTISKSPAGDITKSTEILPAISADGGTVVYAMRAAPSPDALHALLYRYDVAFDTTTQLAGGELVYPPLSALGRPSLSGDGRFAAFVKMGPVLGDGTQRSKLTRLNIATGVQRTVYTSPPAAYAQYLSPALSSSGRFLAFVNGGSVSLYDSNTGDTEVASLADDGGVADNASDQPSISGDGRYVAFRSTATNILPEPTDTVGTYVYDRQTGTTERFGTNLQGVYPRTGPSYPVISPDGNSVVFSTTAKNLSPGANLPRGRVYLWTRPAA